jgi:hypothetical protein
MPASSTRRGGGAIPEIQGLRAPRRRCEMAAMLPRARDYERARRRIEAVREQPHDGADGPIEMILDAAADVLGITGSCWHRTDPASGLPIASAMLGEPADSLEESLMYEFRRPDLNRFEELRSRRSPLAAISTETGGEMGASARLREMIEPSGSADELRAAGPRRSRPRRRRRRATPAGDGSRPSTGRGSASARSWRSCSRATQPRRSRLRW